MQTPDPGSHFVENLDFSLSFWTLASKVLDFHLVFDIEVVKVCNCRHFFSTFEVGFMKKQASPKSDGKRPAPPVDTLWTLF